MPLVMPDVVTRIIDRRLAAKVSVGIPVCIWGGCRDVRGRGRVRGLLEGRYQSLLGRPTKLAALRQPTDPRHRSS
jgi:hypothetical protein